MSKFSCGRFLLLFTAMLPGAMLGQVKEEVAKPEPQFYKLEFVVKEVDGTKVLNSRTYSVIAGTEGPGVSIRAGSKVPLPAAPNSRDVTYMDVGVNIDCRNIKPRSLNGLSLLVNAEISSTIQDVGASSAPPVVRQNKWESTVLAPVKKTVMLYSSDDVTTKHQIQLEMTATPVP